MKFLISIMMIGFMLNIWAAEYKSTDSMHSLIERAKKGDPSAEYLLGMYKYDEYKRGIGKIDTIVALINSSANKNNKEATFVLAALYLKGEGVKQNNVTAYNLFLKAEKLGHPDAKTFKTQMWDTILNKKEKEIVNK